MAERLTAKDWENPMSLMWIKLGLIPMQNEVYRISLSKALSKLAHYEDLEEQGRLIELPCKIGDTIYYILGIPNKTPCEIEETKFYLSDLNRIGKDLFLTREEAETALKGKSNEEIDR